VGISIPYGTKNASARDTANLRPTRFEPGVHPLAFGVDFTTGQSASWTLSPDNNPTVTVNATAASTQCTAAQAVDVGCVLQCRAQLRTTCTRAEESDNCAQYCQDIGHIVADQIPGCNDERVAWQTCVAATPAAASNWNCLAAAESDVLGKGPQALGCDAQQGAYIDCIYYGIGE